MRKRMFKLFLWLFGFRNTKSIGDKKGTIIILIDGLSFDALTYAIRRGFCPEIKKLSSQTHTLRTYYCGLPAATTATEALLFYGNNDNIPGFTWFDRKLKVFVRGNRSKELIDFEDSYPKKRSLFKNGSVIMGVYTGGATELSVSGRNLTFSRSYGIIRTAHYFLMAILYPVQLMRTLYLTLKTIILYRRTNRHSTEQTFSKIILGQFSCFLTEIEIMRNTEKIFVDFLLYDEYAHEYGPTHSTTLSTLRLIDRYISRIVHSIKVTDRPYDIMLLSDHGQTESVPFDFPQVRSIPHIKLALNTPQYEVVKTYGKHFTITDKNKLYVVPAGSTLQLYFSDFLSQGTTEQEINSSFPRFISNLLTYEEFGWILVKQQNSSSTLYGKGGKIIFSIHKAPVLVGSPFSEGEEQEIQRIVHSFQTYALFSNNGDLTLFGNITKDKKVYSFEKHKGTHGGFYGPMTHPFIMSSHLSITGKSMASLFDTIALEI